MFHILHVYFHISKYYIKVLQIQFLPYSSFFLFVCVWHCLINVLPVSVCVSVTQRLFTAEYVSHSTVCEWKIVCVQTLKTKTSCEENDNDSEASGSAGVGVLAQKSKIYYFTHRRLHTIWSSSDKWKMCHCTFHLFARYEKQGAHFICNSAIKLKDCQILFCCFIQLEATFPFKVSYSPAIAPTFFFFKVTSLIALCCAIGVMLRVCCVICCYASTSGMWVLYPFYSSSLPLCLKRTNNPVTTIDNTA